MRYTLKDLFLGLLKTLVLLIVLEIITGAIFPAFGFIQFKFAFSVLIILYMAFKLDTPYLPFLILIIEYVRSAFTIEGWGAGTFASIIIVLSMKYLRGLLEFSSKLSTIIAVQVFQIAFYLILNLIFCVKMNSFDNYFIMTWKYVAPSFALSLISPYFFALMDKLWFIKDRSFGNSL